MDTNLSCVPMKLWQICLHKWMRTETAIFCFNLLFSITVMRQKWQKMKVFIVSHSSGIRRKEQKKGWEIILMWEGDRTMWETLNCMRQYYQYKLVEYAIMNKISTEPDIYGGAIIWLRRVIRLFQTLILSIGPKILILVSKFLKLWERLKI